MIHNRYVRKTLVFPGFIFFLFIFITAAQPVAADYRSKVLGAEAMNLPNIPPTTEGPGLILPDSPLFFLDQLKQAIRINTAFTSEAKSAVYADIAGERYAELRFMLAKNNTNGIKFTLDQIPENYKKSADELYMAKLRGKDVSATAVEINNSIKLKQKDLDVLESAGITGEMKDRVAATQDGLVVAKVKTEEGLVKQDQQNEIMYDLQRQMQRHVQESMALVKEVSDDAKEMQTVASAAAQKQIVVREAALKKAIQENNKTIQKEQEQLLALQKAKNKELMSQEASEANAAMTAVKNSQAAAVKFQSSQKAAGKIYNTPLTSFSPSAKITPTPSPKMTSL